MYKKICTLLLIACIAFRAAEAQIVPADSLALLGGGNISLHQYQGKKILLIALPANQNEADGLLLKNTDSMYTQYKDSIEFIGVPSYEGGYADSLAQGIKAWYRDSLQLGFAITTGMATLNSTGQQQHPLWQWLTHEELNGHFGEHATGNWHKFLLDANGELKMVIAPETALSPALIQFILNTY